MVNKKLNSVIRLNSASGAAVTTAAAVNTDDDYGYEETTPAENVKVSRSKGQRSICC